MCELDGNKMDRATAPRDWYAVLDRDGFGDLYADQAEAERDAETYNEKLNQYGPFRVIHVREATP